MSTRLAQSDVVVPLSELTDFVVRRRCFCRLDERGSLYLNHLFANFGSVLGDSVNPLDRILRHFRECLHVPLELDAQRFNLGKEDAQGDDNYETHDDHRRVGSLHMAASRRGYTAIRQLLIANADREECRHPNDEQEHYDSAGKELKATRALRPSALGRRFVG
jgi:hypothetical protein